MVTAAQATAQTWTGGYFSGQVGVSRIPEGSDNIVVFDRDLDGDFTDTVTSATGANAFSPGFCAGAATTALPSGGCTRDDRGIDVGARGGYDWQMGRIVVGGVGELGFPDHIDSVAAFSTTPAFYTLTRELDWLAGLRGRAGVGGQRVLAYGTGGLAWARVDHRFLTNNAVNTFVESEDQMSWGYQVGGGIDIEFGGRWTVGAEYLWTSLRDEDGYTVRAQGPAPATNPFILGNPAGTDLRRADAFEFGSIRFVMGYRF